MSRSGRDIDHMQIAVAESLGVEDRASDYKAADDLLTRNDSTWKNTP